MVLSVRTDDNWPGGGFAVLSGEGLEGVTAITIESCLSKQLLNAQGQWGKFPHPFRVARTPSGALLLGPDIVDHVPTELFILLRNQDGAELGRIFWVDVMPSRNPGSATSEDVLAVHRERAASAEAMPEPSPPPPPPKPPSVPPPISAPLPPPTIAEVAPPPPVPPAGDHGRRIAPIDAGRPPPVPPPPPLPPTSPVMAPPKPGVPSHLGPPPVPRARLGATSSLPIGIGIAIACVFGLSVLLKLLGLTQPYFHVSTNFLVGFAVDVAMIALVISDARWPNPKLAFTVVLVAVSILAFFVLASVYFMATRYAYMARYWSTTFYLFQAMSLLRLGIAVTALVYCIRSAFGTGRAVSVPAGPRPAVPSS